MKKTTLIFLIIFGVVFLDLISKGTLLYLITGTLPLSGAAWDVVPVPYLMAHVFDFFNIVFTWNPGTSFSLFRTMGEVAPMILIVGTGFITGFILYYLLQNSPLTN